MKAHGTSLVCYIKIHRQGAPMKPQQIFEWPQMTKDSVKAKIVGIFLSSFPDWQTDSGGVGGMGVVSLRSRKVESQRGVHAWEFEIVPEIRDRPR